MATMVLTWPGLFRPIIVKELRPVLFRMHKTGQQYCLIHLKDISAILSSSFKKYWRSM
jgi:hypothetical protein